MRESERERDRERERVRESESEWEWVSESSWSRPASQLFPGYGVTGYIDVYSVQIYIYIYIYIHVYMYTVYNNWFKYGWWICRIGIISLQHLPSAKPKVSTVAALICPVRGEHCTLEGPRALRTLADPIGLCGVCLDQLSLGPLPVTCLEETTIVQSHAWIIMYHKIHK